jgi:hypothetical protein
LHPLSRTGFSAQPLFSSALISTFNLFWCATPTVAFAVLEQDLDEATVLAYPPLYRWAPPGSRGAAAVEQPDAVASCWNGSAA